MNRRSFLATFAVLLLVGFSAVAAEPKRPLGVPADAKHFDGRWFRLYGEKITWKNARQRCERLGGRLACIPDAETNQFVKSVAEGVIAWLGATDEKTEGRWIWIDASPVTFKGWR